MPDTRLPERLFYCELAEGTRSQSGQKKHYKECFKASLKSFDIDIETWETLVLDRPAWRSKPKKGTVLFEQHRRGSEEAWAEQIQSGLLNTCSRNSPVAEMRQSLQRSHWIYQPQLETPHLTPPPRDVIVDNDGRTTRLYFPPSYSWNEAKLIVTASAWWPLNRGDNNDGRTLVGMVKQVAAAA